MNHPSHSPRLRRILFAVLIVLMLPLLFWWGAETGAAQSAPDVPQPGSPAAIAERAKALRPTVSLAVRHDVSPPLREIVPLPPSAKADVQPWFALPKAEKSNSYGPQEMEAAESAAQNANLLAALSTTSVPSPIITFDGVHNVNGVLPPDTVGDVGPNHYVQMVNLSYTIFDKLGNTLYGPANTNTVWSGFGGVCQTQNDGDPIVLYDQLADRWMISQFGLDFPDNFHECIAISQTPDPMGAWYRYDFKISSTKMNDYPHFGIWPDAYYMSVNQFDGTTFGWQGQGVVAFEREQMLQGLPARMVYFDLFGISDLLGGMLPADWDGMSEPPNGAPNPFVMIDDDTWDASYPVDQLEVWEFHVDWNNLAASSFTGPRLLPTQSPFDSRVTNIPQPDTGVRLDAIADRLMNRLQYRNFGTHQSLVVNHTVAVGGRAGIRWYELRNTGGGWQIYQEGTFAPDANHRWMGSMAMDGSGNIALGYSVSSGSLYPSIRYTARTKGDALGTLSANEQEIKAGTGSQTHSAARWGDYSQMSVDPTDECIFWYTTEYIAVTGSAPWRTHIGSFRLPECTGSDAGSLAGHVADGEDGQPIRNAQVRAGSFSAVTDLSGAYTMRMPSGAYTVTISAYGYESAITPNIEVATEVTTTLNASLTKIPLVPVQGSVVDGSGTGWPLYAELSIEGYPNSPIYTHPLTGRYAVDLLDGIPVTFTVRSTLSGYLSQSRTITPTASHAPEEFILLVDTTSCVAAGYAVTNGGGIFEDFEAIPEGEIPAGWTVIDNAGNNQVWQFTDPGDRNNLTGGRGDFATVDSDAYGQGGLQDTELRTPVLDFSDRSEVRLAYNHYYRTYTSADKAKVDVSNDGGLTWTTVITHPLNTSEGVREDLDISALAANQAAVQVRFHYSNAIYQWYWQLDDVLVGLQSCVPTGEGLVLGHVYDANTGEAVNEATVSNGAGKTAVTFDTPRNFNLDGGLYLMPISQGSYTLTATANRYGVATRPLTVTELAISALDLHMPAGQLAVTSGVNLTLPVNGPTQAIQVILNNVGGMGVNFNLVTVEGAQLPPAPALTYASRKRKFPSKLLNDATAVNVYTHAAPVAPTLAGGDLLGYWDSGLADAWGIAYDLDADSLWLNSRADERAHRFLPDGTGRDASADLSNWVTAFAADMAYDPVSHQVWALNVGGDNCLHAFDAAPGPNQGAYQGDRICPDFTITQRGLAYNPLRDTFFSGSWTNEIVYEFDRQGQVVSAANLGLAISGLAYNPATDHLFVLTNADTGFDVYVVDVTGAGRGGYEILGGFDILGLGGWDQAGLALGCDGSLWAVDQVAGTVLRAASGETGICDWTASEWLIVSPTAGAISAGGQKILTFTFNPQTLKPGVAVGAVRMGTDSPYGVFSIPVTLTIANTYGVSLAETTQDRSGLPGQVVTYTVTVQNSGTVTDSYSLSLSGHKWSSQSPTAVGPIPLRGSETVVVSVTIPGGAAPGDRDTLTVNLASITDPAAQIKGSLTTTAGTFAVSLSPGSSSLSGDPGTTLTHTVTITNQGTVTDSFALSKMGSTWLTTMPATVGPLAPGAALPVAVTVDIPAGTAAGASNNATLTATSMADRLRSTSIALKTTAKAVYQVSMTPNGESGKSGIPGTQVTYSLVITNQSNLATSFSLDWTGNLWATGAPVQVGPLAAYAGSETVKVWVSVPITAPVNAIDQMTLTVMALMDSAAKAQTVISTTAGVLRAGAWSEAIYAAQSLPGQQVTLTLMAANTGNVSDAYTLTLSGPDQDVWQVQVTDQLHSLAPGNSATVPVRVTIPLVVQANEMRAWTVDLVSQTTGQVVASTTVQVTAQNGGHALFLPHLAR